MKCALQLNHAWSNGWNILHAWSLDPVFSFQPNPIYQTEPSTQLCPPLNFVIICLSPFLPTWTHLALPGPSMRFCTIPNFDLLTAFMIYAFFTLHNAQSLNTYSTSLNDTPTSFSTTLLYTYACTLPNVCVYIVYQLYPPLIKICRSHFSSAPWILQFSHLSSHSRQNGWLVNAYVHFIRLHNNLYALYQQ